MTPADISDYRELARRRLPFFLFEYIDGGSYAETTLARNMGDFQSIILRQNVMRDVSKLNLAIELFGQKWAMPVALSPIGLGGMYARRGEVQTARAAEKNGVPFTLSTMSCCAIEEVRPKVDTPPWLQLYMIKDRAFMADLLGRAAAADITNLVLTVDLPVHSVRHRDVRSGLTGPQGLDVRFARFVDVLCHPFWAFDVGVMGRPHILGNVAPAMPNGAGLDQFTAWVGRNFDPSITWKDLDWIRGHWKGRLIIK
ncbi:MAG TPA: alpha-hydroxy-acid oxidizing protein, partial [Terricaulis sp.]|nr:alpha-hydroxy-acid oxidizing protein [Terricaulis sp.]